MDESLTDTMYFIMLALLNPQHGYAIMKEISEVSHGHFEIGPASMYTTLKKLTKLHFLEMLETKDRKKVYQLTPLGKEKLQQEVARRKKFYQVGETALKKAGVHVES